MDAVTLMVSNYVTFDSVAVIGFIKASLMVMKFYAVCEES